MIITRHLRHINPHTAAVEPRGGVTVVLVHANGTNTCCISTALCSSKDNFCRSMGRSLAVERLKQGIGIMLPCSPSMDEYEAHDIINSLFPSMA